MSAIHAPAPPATTMTDGHAVNATLAHIATRLDSTDPRQMDLLRTAADAAHTLHATTASTPLRRRAVQALRHLHLEVVGPDEPCPLAD